MRIGIIRAMRRILMLMRFRDGQVDECMHAGWALGKGIAGT